MKTKTKMYTPLLISCFWVSLFLLSACASLKPTTSHTTRYQNHQVHYLSEGHGSKTIVFIHGWSCDTSFWKYQTDYFKKDYRVIAIDLPGHGKSEKPKTAYTFDLFAESVKIVMDDVGIEKAFFVGHSMGYPVARHFITKYPRRVSGLCIVDGAYFRLPKEPEALGEWEKQNDDFIQAFKSGDREAFIDHFLESLFVKDTPLLLKKELKARILKTPPHVANSAMEEMVRSENWKEYALPIPTLAVYAVSPDLPEDNEAYLRSLFPDMEYHVWDNVGHFIQLEQPQRFNRLLEEYLKDHIGLR